MPRPAGITDLGRRRRDDIVRHAEILINSGTFYQMTMAGIADSIGIGKSSIYHYFKKKEDILCAMQVETLTSLVAHVKAVRSEGLPPVETLLETLRFSISQTANSPGKVRMLFEARDKLPPDVRQMTDEMEREYIALVRLTIREAQAVGSFVGLDDLVLANAMLGAVNNTRFWVDDASGRPWTTDELTDTLWSLLSQGLSAAEGPVPAR